MTEQLHPVGFLLINKPAGITSRDAINALQKLLPKKAKIGHAGTLDRFAHGLLIVGIGRPATRLFKYLMKLDKKYWVRAKLGELTDTMDNTGNILTTKSADDLTLKKLQQIFDQFPSKYEQTPPVFSALKWQGKRLSDLVRYQAETDTKLQAILQSKMKTVDVYDLNLIHYDMPFMTFYAHVSHGTYIRALANDIAQKGANVATTYELKRTEIGPFKLADATDLDSIETVTDIERFLVSIDRIITLLHIV